MPATGTTTSRPPCSCVGRTKSPPRASIRHPTGTTISKGYRNYHLMLNLQLGIRHAVRKSAAKSIRELRRAYFDPREMFRTRFAPTGSKTTPLYPSSEFRWKDYCPMLQAHEEVVHHQPGGLHSCNLKGRCSVGSFLTREERKLFLPSAGRALPMMRSGCRYLDMDLESVLTLLESIIKPGRQPQDCLFLTSTVQYSTVQMREPSTLLYSVSPLRYISSSLYILVSGFFPIYT